MPYGADPPVANSGYGRDPVQSDVPPATPTPAFPAIRSGAESFLRGLNTGIAGDVVGAGQLAARVLPQSVTAPIANSTVGQNLSRQAQTPTQGLAGQAGSLTGAVAPFLMQPELGIGALLKAAPYIGRALPFLWNAIRTGTLPAVLQPTSPQTAADPAKFDREKATQAGVGTVLGAAGELPGAAVKALGYRDVPQLLRTMERHSPQFVQKTFDAMRQLSIPGFNKAWSAHVLEPLGLKAPEEVGHAGMSKLDDMIGKELDNATRGMTLDATPGTRAAAAISKAQSDATDRLLSNGAAATSFNRLVNRAFGRPLAASLNKFTTKQFQDAVSNLKTLADGIDPGMAESRAVKQELNRFRDEIISQATGGDKARYQAARESWRRFATARDAIPPTEQMFTPGGILTQLDRRSPFEVPLGRARGQDVAQAGHEALLLPGRAAQRAQAGLPPRRPSLQPLTTGAATAVAQGMSDARRRPSVYRQEQQ